MDKTHINPPKPSPNTKKIVLGDKTHNIKKLYWGRVLGGFGEFI